MEVNDIVLTKKLDYSKIKKPTDKEELVQHEKIVKELTALSRLPFKVVSKHNVDGIDYIVIEGLGKKKITIGESEYPITVREDEVDVVETDYLNNCCRATIRGTIRDDFICQTCAFSIGTLLKRH